MANSNFKKLLSIHLQSNDPKNFKEFVASLEKHIKNKNLIEICVKIDDNDEAMNLLLAHLKKSSSIDIKYISTPLLDGFSGLWRSMNDLLLICEKDTYFIWNMNDEMRVPIIGWDTILIKYVGTFSDNLFRLRTSKFRSRIYSDIWECCFAPETSAITTKKWITTSGNWNPTLGPDTFNQLVAYYFSYHDRYNRDREIRDVVINDFIFEGEGASIGYSKKESVKRLFATTESWFKLVSYKTQLEASRRSQIIKAQIYKEKTFKNSPEYKDIYITYDNNNVLIKLFGTILCKFPYKISRLKTFLRNFRKSLNFFMYGGAGYDFRNHAIKGKIQILSNQFTLYVFHIILRYKLKGLYNLLRKIGLSKYIFHKKYSQNIIYKILKFIILLPKRIIFEAIKPIKIIFYSIKYIYKNIIPKTKKSIVILKNNIYQLLILLAKNIYKIIRNFIRNFIRKIATILELFIRKILALVLKILKLIIHVVQYIDWRKDSGIKYKKYINFLETMHMQYYLFIKLEVPKFYKNFFLQIKFAKFKIIDKLKLVSFKIKVSNQRKPLSDTDYKNFINKINFSDLLSQSEFSFVKNRHNTVFFVKILLLFKFYNLNISEIKNNRDLIYFSLTDIKKNEKLARRTNNDINFLFKNYSDCFQNITKLDYILKTKFNYNLRSFLY